MRWVLRYIMARALYDGVRGSARRGTLGRNTAIYALGVLFTFAALRSCAR